MKRSIFSFFTIALACFSSTVCVYAIDQNVIHASLSPKNVQVDPKDLDPKMAGFVSKINATLKAIDDKKTSECDQSQITSLSNMLGSSSRGLLDDINFLLALNLEVCGDYANAKKYYDKSLELRRRNSIAIFRLATIAIRDKDLKKANSLIQEAKWEKFPDQYLLSFLIGMIALENKEYEQALKTFNESLAKKPTYLPAAMAAYQTKLALKPTIKDENKLAQLDAQIINDIALLNRLDPDNSDIALGYMKYLLASGHPLNSPAKLNEGLKISGKWFEKNGTKKYDYALLKIQFFEKLHKNQEALNFINELESKNPLPPALQAKKLSLTPEPASEES